MPEVNRPLRSLVRRLMLAFVILGALFVGVSGFFAYKLTGARQRPVGPVPADFPYAAEEVSWTTPDGQTIRGWFVPGEDRERVIVLLHGYAGDRRSMLPRARVFRQAGYAVLLYDSRACGESSGDLVTFGHQEASDLVAGLDWLRQRGFGKIACLGVSQGGATILMAADQLHDVRCVICESVFDELGHAVDNRFRHYLLIPGWLAGCLMVPLAEQRTGIALDEVKPVERIGQLACPVFIMSGADDSKTLPAETQRLFEAATGPKELWLVPQAGHEDLFRPEYAQKVLAFVDRNMR